MIKLKELITEQIDTSEQVHIHDLKKVPSYFERTWYELPTQQQIKQIHQYNLTPNQIKQGIGYTIVGRGISSRETDNMEIEVIDMLIQKYPNDEIYKQAKQLILNSARRN